METNWEGIADLENGEYTQAGTGQRLVMMFRDRLKWCKDTGKWYEFVRSTNLWKQVDEARIYHYVLEVANKVKADAQARLHDTDECKARTNAKDYAKRIQAISFTKGAIAFAKDAFTCEQKLFDSNPQYLGLPDGNVINLLTGKVEVGKAEYFLTKQLAGNVKESTSAEWEVFIRKFLPEDDVRRYLQLFCGSALLGHEYRSSDDKKALFIDSVSGSGKTTFLKVLKPALADYYKETDIKLLTTEIKDPNKPNPLLSTLQGARIVGFSEVPANVQFTGDVFKRLTGNDECVTRTLNEKPFSFTPDFRLLIMCNDLPRPDCTDDISFRCRFRRIYRDKPIAEEDKDINIQTKAKTQEWKDDVVTWLVHGATEYLSIDGRMDDYNGANLRECNLPTPIKEAIQNYVNDNDDMEDFFKANFKRDERGRVSWQDIYQIYIDYTNDHKTDYYNFVRNYKKAIRRYGLKSKRAWVNMPSKDGSDITEPKCLECVLGIRMVKRTDALDDIQFVKQIKTEQKRKTSAS